MTAPRTSIRVGQRLLFWDGTRGYVCLNTSGQTTYQKGEDFKVAWLDDAGDVLEEVYYRLEDFAEEGITFGRGVMPWAR